MRELLEEQRQYQPQVETQYFFIKDSKDSDKESNNSLDEDPTNITTSSEKSRKAHPKPT